MIWNIVQDSWKQLKGKAVAHWDKLDNINAITKQGDGAAQDEAKEQIEPIKGTQKE